MTNPDHWLHFHGLPYFQASSLTQVFGATWMTRARTLFG